ncbi:hypothetical protein SteCoe_6079 [Stentor coeruleus]|uniref:Structural maintenance of chromosomes protein n=1 Tax=Stentor coeruleus TaxID=5963 RepID=A0A1R2CQX7_9CILI|nr:hypothetical protein SteCoe_6079 [Stentor coeruleus]
MEVDKLQGRLIIEKVIIKNFKSYAGEKIIGPFHKSLTSVVGPNGSGKSNLLESLLFAFGKRARKMRLKRLSELIHHSNTYPNVSEASVEVYFQNIIDTENEGFEVVSNSKLILTRIVRKNNTSEYRLNNSSSTYEEVTNTLKNRGIDLEHNRFLILQGEVEQIATMSPKAPPGDDNKIGLLEYLEEIIGTDKYVADIEKAEKELEEIIDEITSKKLRFEEAKKVCDQLEGPMREAIRYIDTEKESYSFKCLKCRLEKQKRIFNSEKIAEKILEQEKKLADLEEFFNQKRKANELAIADYEQKARELMKIRQEKLSIENSIKSYMQKDQTACEDLKLLKSTIKTLESEKESNTRRCNDISSDIENYKNIVPQKSEILNQIKNLRISKEQIFNQKASEIELITQDLQAKKKILESERAPIKREMAKLNTEKDSKINEISELENEIKSSDTDKVQVSQNISNLENTISNTQSQLNESYEILKQYLYINDKQAKIIQLKNLALEKNKTLMVIGDKITAYEREEKKTLNNKSQLSEILRAKIEKKLIGVYGRLGDLGVINSIYDIAVSSGIPGLDYIVVDTVTNGNDLINFVREKNLGKVNIIVLEKLKNTDRNIENFQTPDKRVERLFDQIRISDPKFKYAFYHMFGDTLFTQNIEDARRIALGENRYKVVTKDGDIINPSGEMRGFANPTRGKMKLIGQTNTYLEVDIQGLKKIYKEHQDDLENINIERNTLENEVNDLKNKDRELRQKINVLEININSLKDRLKAMNSRLDSLNERSIPDMQLLISKLQCIIEKIIQSLKKTEIIIRQKDMAINEIDAKIEETAGVEFKKLKDDVRKLNTEEEIAEKELSKVQAGLLQRQKDLEKYSKQLEKDIGELEDLLKKQEDLKKEKEKYSELAKEKLLEMEDYLKKENEQEKMIKELEIQKKEIAKEFDSILTAKNEAELKKRQLCSEMKDLKVEVQKWQIRLEHTIEDFRNMEKDYLSIFDGIAIENNEPTNPEHQSKKNLFAEERKNLFRPVDWEATEAELNEMIDKIQIIGEIEKLIDDELSTDRPNLNIIQEYKNRLDDKTQKEKNLSEAKQHENTLKNLYIEYKNKRFNEFTKGIREISLKLREMYCLLTRGGGAELEFADSTDPFAEGIIFTVRPPSKNWQKMANLSGGEKTLSSLALVFALHHYKPNSLYVMDEVDAALDFQNVSVIANYIKGETKNAQFIVVSLRYQMFEVADQLVGIYKTKDISHSLCVSPYSLKEIGNKNPIIRQTLENISMKDN